MKDHETFLRAAAILLAAGEKKVTFLCIGGQGKAPYVRSLRSLTRELGIDEHVKWLPSDDAVREIYSALDILCLSSAYGEGFPNVVAEGMACGLPCVVTDVGDSGVIVQDLGWVVAPRDPAAMAATLATAVSAMRSDKREARRQSIAKRFSVEAMVINTESLIVPLIERSDEGAPRVD
jgi:glycosyltransferase involved in cell wall biosynthesis